MTTFFWQSGFYFDRRFYPFTKFTVAKLTKVTYLAPTLIKNFIYRLEGFDLPYLGQKRSVYLNGNFISK